MTIDGLKVRDDCGMPCPICCKAAEFERAFGTGGIILCEHFVCRPCRARIERHYRVDRTISVIKVQPLESCSWVNEPAQTDIDNTTGTTEGGAVKSADNTTKGH